MDKFVLTIGRQIGAGGLTVAKALAEELGVKMYDKELLSEVAKSSGLSPDIFESRDETTKRRGLSSFFGGRSMNHLNESMSEGSILGDDSLFKIQSDVMHSLAEEGSCIFVGRCADYILRDHPNILNVFITASKSERISRIMAAKNMTESEAERYIDQGEKKRASYYNYFTFKKWGDSSSYDLCVSSSALGGSAAVVETIKSVMKQKYMI